MSFVRCDRCGNPGPMAEDAKEARQAGRVEGFKRCGTEDVCRFCVAKAKGAKAA